MISEEWYLSKQINRYLNEDLYLIKSKKEIKRRQKMKGSFYHDTIEGPGKIKAYFIVAEKEDVSTTSPLDEVGQIVLNNDEVYVYTKDLEYKKIALAS